ncbi:hypothetical protein Pmani_020722 [Petrolisthes manimaculis]|uniref:Uncharacterized protein n=1 Tax=Petrolisthes manimaculis TaxID=1843537 RepID=A0AAE1PF53_9EUCA|nr:hypothetical protein Pmani_020722 [Petrolisthes manimaculis]
MLERETMEGGRRGGGKGTSRVTGDELGVAGNSLSGREATERRGMGRKGGGRQGRRAHGAREGSKGREDKSGGREGVDVREGVRGMGGEAPQGVRMARKDGYDVIGE